MYAGMAGRDYPTGIARSAHWQGAEPSLHSADVTRDRKEHTYPFEAMFPAGVAASGEYDPDNDRLDPRLIERFQRLATPMVRYFRTDVVGIEHLPWNQGCLCIGNHALWGIDSAVLLAAVHKSTGRMLRGLGDHILFKVPLLSEFFVRFGAVDGNQENAQRLLQAGEWAICYPGGARDSFKRPEERYRLKWHNRVGYLRCALAAQVPLVPIAGIGIDDAYVTLGHERKIGRRLFGRPTYDIPIFIGLGLLPLPVKFTYYIGEPIDLGARFGLGAEDAKAPLEDLLPAHADIWGHTQAMIDDGLRRRRGRFF
jgi:1-acyl-sn-glycerol-3-phosphate acyltransferase